MKLRVCPTCSKEFRVFERDYALGRKLYCCIGCRRKKEDIFVECKNCKNILRRLPSEIRQGRRLYCNLTCYHAVHKKK